LPIWFGGETPGLAVRGGCRGAASGLLPGRLLLIDSHVVTGIVVIDVRDVDGLALRAGDA
jgi:hypothetical protein